jgi:hypothetical protein
MNYYIIDTENEIPAKWNMVQLQTLSTPGKELSIWEFTEGAIYSGTTPVHFASQYNESVPDFNQDPFGNILISEKLAKLLMSIAGNQIQFIPALLDGVPNWYVLNITNVVDCIDYDKSIIKYQEEVAPKHQAKIFSIPLLILDVGIIASNTFFRVKNWLSAIIISENIMIDCQLHEFTNMQFTCVAPAINDIQILQI